VRRHTRHQVITTSHSGPGAHHLSGATHPSKGNPSLTMDSSSNTTEASYNLEFQLLLRQRRVNELLVRHKMKLTKNEINELRRQVEPTDRIPYVVDNLINGLKRNIASQEDELGLLNQVVLAAGKPEAERYSPGDTYSGR